MQVVFGIIFLFYLSRGNGVDPDQTQCFRRLSLTCTAFLCSNYMRRLALLFHHFTKGAGRGDFGTFYLLPGGGGEHF